MPVLDQGNTKNSLVALLNREEIQQAALENYLQINSVLRQARMPDVDWEQYEQPRINTDHERGIVEMHREQELPAAA